MLAFTGCGTEGDSSSDANSGNVVDDSAESESTVEDGSADAESEGADDSADAESEDAEGEIPQTLSPKAPRERAPRTLSPKAS